MGFAGRTPSYRKVHRFIEAHRERLNEAFGFGWKAAHVLSAFAIDDALILGHLEVDAKGNEIPAARAMIEALALEGRLFTLDAMHCQKNIPDGP